MCLECVLLLILLWWSSIGNNYFLTARVRGRKAQGEYSCPSNANNICTYVQSKYEQRVPDELQVQEVMIAALVY